MAGEEEVVAITVKTIGPTRPSTLQVPAAIKVRDLRALVAEDRRLPSERLKLVLRGRTLHDKKKKHGGDDIEDELVKLANGDSLIVAVMPKPPAQHLHDDGDDDDYEEEELKFRMPASTSWLKRKIFLFLQEKMGFPDIVLMALFSVSLKAWVLTISWFLLAPVAHRWDLGALYILVTGFSIILLNLGKKQQGDLSAYSIFNENFRELPGTLNADRLDRDIRAGQF